MSDKAFPVIQILIDQAAELDEQADTVANDEKAAQYTEAAKIIRLAAQIALAGAEEVLSSRIK